MSLWDARVGEWMISAWVVPPWSMEEEVWWCGGVLLVTLSVIQGTINQHGYHSILQRYAIPSGLRIVGLSFVFQQDNDPKPTSRLCTGYLTKKESGGVVHQMTWPPQSPDLNPDWGGLGWVGPQSEIKAANKCSAYVGTPSRLLEKHSRWRWMRECQECAKLSSRQRVGTLKNLK